MKQLRTSFVAVCLLLTVSLFSSCSGIKDTMENAERLRFKLGTIDKITVGGMNLSNVTSVSQLNISQSAGLLASLASGSLPTSLTVNLIAKNPDTYPGGTKESSSLIKGLDWRLIVDGQELIAGEIDKTIEIPGVGKQVTIPIPVKVDLFKMLGDGGLEKVINLVNAMNGTSGASSRVSLKIKPTIDTFLGGIAYPGEIEVVSKEFR
jgi:hypothetical protein